MKFLWRTDDRAVKMSCWALLWLLLLFVSRGNAGGCPEPVPEANVMLSDAARVKNNFPDGSEVTLECALGYVVDQGSDTIKCVNNEWSKQELTCKKKDCGPPEPTQNMDYIILNGTFFGAYIRPVCHRGYYLEGSSFRQCLANGWSERAKCLLVTCEKLPKIPHSFIVSDPTKEVLGFNDVIEYGCEDEYTLVGNGSVICQENGLYSSLPQCKERQDDGTADSLLWNPVVAIGSGFAVLIIAVFIGGFVYALQRNKKRKGSYDTGEGMRTKEVLMQENSFSYLQSPSKDS